MSNILEVHNVSKQYRLGTVGTGTLSHDLNRWWYKVRGKEDPYLKIGSTNDRSGKADSDYVWALKDINFNVKEGEVLGIIGKNGAGKSTLLKILSRVTGPTTGSIKAYGRIASLLEVGTGFHPELTGRENIFLNGAILGMSKFEIKSKFDEIVDFSGCERYIDTPVKRYSSGMYVRLAFAVAAHLEPEILIVDEVLAVGDAEFQKKALGKMKDISTGQGRTVLFVSHNMAAVRSLCDRGIQLINGTIAFTGDVDTCVSNYLKGNNGLVNEYILPSNAFRKDVFVESANILAETTDYIDISLVYHVRKDTGFVVALKLINAVQIPIYTVLDTDDNLDLFYRKAGKYSVCVRLPLKELASGLYFVTISLSDMKSERFDFLENVIIFEKEHDMNIKNIFSGREGVLNPLASWSINKYK